MTNELKPVRCGCGGEAVIWHNFGGLTFVSCKDCEITSHGYDNHFEAIRAWNKAMGERTAKAEWSEVDGCHLCGECGFAVAPHCDVYCAGCGARLEWK